MSIVFDEGFFDQEGEVVLGEPQRTALLRLLRKAESHRMSHVGNEASVLLVEDVFLFAGKEQIGESLSDLISDIGEVKRLLVAIRTRHRNTGEGVCWYGKGFAPGEIGFLIARHGDKALQSDVFVK